MTADYLLYESSVGYSIFKVALQADSVGNRLKEVQERSQNLATFGKMVDLVSFAPFQGASQALENANEISEGLASNFLMAVVEANIPKSKSKKSILGVSDKNLASSIKSSFPYIECETSETSEVVADLLRGLRQHAPKLLKQLQETDIGQAQLGLGHAYSRARVKFSVQKNDNHIIQAIATLDHLEKAVNTFSMRVREWYSWHFPELVRLVSENQKYATVALFIGDKKSLSDDKLHELAALVDDDEAVAQSIINAAKVSMGRDMSEGDMDHVMNFAKRAVQLSKFRKSLQNYLISKMSIVAPNVAALIGDTVGARLIAKAGSLTNLAKCAASTVQILGAEKALFRALKTKGATPKYGLIYHSSFIQKAGPKNKGRISRFLANKTSVAARIDNFSDAPTRAFGEALRKQVEERIDFYNTGAAPSKNADVMKTAMDSVLSEIQIDPTATADEDVEMADGVTAQATDQKVRSKVKKDKKEKKEKRKSKSAVDEDDAEAEEEVKEVKKEKKDKKKRKHDDDEGKKHKKSKH